MRYRTYDDYLLSSEWKAKAEARKRLDNYHCVMCGCIGTQNNKLNIHHISYRNVFHEDIEKDLVTVCNICHASVHRMMNRITNVKTGERGWHDTLPRYVKHVEVDSI